MRFFSNEAKNSDIIKDNMMKKMTTSMKATRRQGILFWGIILTFFPFSSNLIHPNHGISNPATALISLSCIRPRLPAIVVL